MSLFLSSLSLSKEEEKSNSLFYWLTLDLKEGKGGKKKRCWGGDGFFFKSIVC